MIQAILHWNVSPYRDRSLQYLRKSKREHQFLLQLQSTPLNNQLCDQIKMFPQGQSSTGVFLPVLEKKFFYAKPEVKSLNGKTHAVLRITFLLLKLMALIKFSFPCPGKHTLPVAFIMAPIQIKEAKNWKKVFLSPFLTCAFARRISKPFRNFERGLESGKLRILSITTNSCRIKKKHSTHSNWSSTEAVTKLS